MITTVFPYLGKIDEKKLELLPYNVFFSKSVFSSFQGCLTAPLAGCWVKRLYFDTSIILQPEVRVCLVPESRTNDKKS